MVVNKLRTSCVYLEIIAKPKIQRTSKFFHSVQLRFLIPIYTFSFSDEDRQNVRALGNLNQDMLYDALKYESLKDHIDLDEDEHETVAKISKGKMLSKDFTTINFLRIFTGSPIRFKMTQLL